MANLGIMATIFAEAKVTEKLRKVSSATRFSRFSRATTTSSGSARASGADAGVGRTQAKLELELELELSELDHPEPGREHVNPLFKPRSSGNRVTMDDMKSIEVVETVVETVVEMEAATGTGTPMMHMAEGELPAATDGAPDVV